MKRMAARKTDLQGRVTVDVTADPALVLRVFYPL